MNLTELKTLHPKELKKVKELNLSNVELKKEDMDYLSIIAPSLHSLEMIHCKQVKLKDKHFARLLGIFALCPSVAYLFLNDNKLHSGSINTLAKMLPSFHSLISLDLSGNNIKAISDEEITTLIAAVKKTPSLFVLNFGKTKMAKDESILKAELEAHITASKKLLQAVNQNDKEKVQSLLNTEPSQRTVNINALTYFGKKEESLISPLHLAAKNGNASMVELLLSLGARATLVDALGRTPVELIKKELQNPTHPKRKELRETLKLFPQKTMYRSASMSALPRKSKLDSHSASPSSSRPHLFSQVTKQQETDSTSAQSMSKPPS